MTKGQRIKSRRTELNISQTDLAKTIDVSKQTLYKYENDIVTNIPSDNIEKLAFALSVSPAWIMGFPEPSEAFSFSPEEISIAMAYRKAPELTKDAAANVLGVKREGTAGSTVSKGNVG